MKGGWSRIWESSQKNGTCRLGESGEDRKKTDE